MPYGMPSLQEQLEHEESLRQQHALKYVADEAKESVREMLLEARMVDRVVVNFAKNTRIAKSNLDSLRLPTLSVGECMNCVATEAARQHTQTLYEAMLRENERLRQENRHLRHHMAELTGENDLEDYEPGIHPEPTPEDKDANSAN